MSGNESHFFFSLAHLSIEMSGCADGLSVFVVGVVHVVVSTVSISLHSLECFFEPLTWIFFSP